MKSGGVRDIFPSGQHGLASGDKTSSRHFVPPFFIAFVMCAAVLSFIILEAYILL